MNTTRMERSILHAVETLRINAHVQSEYVGYYYAHRDAARAYDAHRKFMEYRDAWLDLDTLRREMFGEVVG